MYLYSDIVELSPVGNSKVPIMGFLPIKSNFQEKWPLGNKHTLVCQGQGNEYQNNHYENFNRNW